jgi:uncharacterized protein YcbK (DUF882 family)
VKGRRSVLSLTLPVRVLGATLGLATALTAFASPPAGSHHAPAAPAAGKGLANAALRANENISAYFGGKQALVGLHAPSPDAVPRDPQGRPMLALHTVNRNESLTLAASQDDGGFDSVDLDRAAHLLRAMSGDEHPVDPRTLALVYKIQTHFGVPEIRVVSGYRVPRPRSHSNHGKGRAIDLIVPGTADEDVATFVRGMGFVGVGVYPRSQFVHVDIRPRSYFWVDTSGPHMKNRERGILGDLATRSDAQAASRGQVPIEPFGVQTDVDSALRTLGAGTSTAPPEEDEDDEN